jgi:hypothetical protein
MRTAVAMMRSFLWFMLAPSPEVMLPLIESYRVEAAETNFYPDAEFMGQTGGGQEGWGRRGQRVRLEIQTSTTNRDRYGRLLTYVFRQSNDLLVNKEIIRQSHRHACTKYPFDPTRMEQFRPEPENFFAGGLSVS